MTKHQTLSPSEWVQRWTHLVRPGGRVLDLACGHGRHSHWMASHGFEVTAIDRDASALAHAAEYWPGGTHPGTLVQADVENGAWPLPVHEGHWDAIVVTHYLWRPLWPVLMAGLAPGGVYIHETFAHGNASVGKPSRPDFLLQPGELLTVCRSLRVVAFEDGFLPGPDRYLQRIAAVQSGPPAVSSEPPPRYRL